MAKTFVLTRKQFIPASMQEVWSFFSSPHNLERITPKALSLSIRQCPDVSEIFRGMQIDYTVKPLLRIPLKWRTVITDVDAPHRFIDVQMKGPYRIWRHEHRFVPANGGVLMEDVITYHPGGGWFAKWIDKFVVASRLNAIFDYREKVVHEIFKKSL